MDLLNLVDEKLLWRKFLVEDWEQKSEKKSECLAEVDSLGRQVADLVKVHGVFTKIYEQLNMQGLKALSELLNRALKAIFHDRNYEVFYKVEESRGANHLHLFLREVKPDGRVIVSNIRTSVGGSIRMVVGLVCLIFYLVKMKAERVIALDENLSQISDRYVGSFFEFLQGVIEEGDFVIILVTQDPRFTPFLTKEYRMGQDGILVEIRKDGRKDVN